MKDKFKDKCKLYNFEVRVEFANEYINQSIADTLMLMISSISTEFKNNIKYVNLCINTYVDTSVEESYIPDIKKIKIHRYDENGNLLLTTIYNNCTFICSELKHINYDDVDIGLGMSPLDLNVVYKFVYDDMIIESNNGGKINV